MNQMLTSILQQATSQGYRSNVVKPLMGMVIILLCATAVLFYVKFFLFATIIGGLAIAIVVAFLIAYFYCLWKNPDLLRSERYNLEKTAMEKTSITGDSLNGQIQLPQRDYVIIEANNSTVTNSITSEEN